MKKNYVLLFHLYGQTAESPYDTEVVSIAAGGAITLVRAIKDTKKDLQDAKKVTGVRVILHQVVKVDEE